ncbi:MAG: putative glutathione S-transferase [Cognaticolwellia sp.]|jgi:putative glutathione S-transferase
MAQLVNGHWVEDVAVPKNPDGGWSRVPAKVHGWIREHGDFPPEKARYHLWLAWNCTWSQRTLIVRNLLGMQDAFPATMAHWHRNDNGWWFREGLDELVAEEPQSWEAWNAEKGFVPAEPSPGLPLYRIYQAHDVQFTGRCTVPALWDRKTGTMVNNESSEILKMLQEDCRALGNGRDLLPAEHREQIQATNTWVYDAINNGVYKVGFAHTQGAYERALHTLFSALERCEVLLSEHRYLCGDVLTEADVRLFPTLVRFDAVYFQHFKCSLKRIVDYPNLSAYLCDLYQTPGFAETVDVHFTKLGYMGRSERLNPSRIIPPGPALDWDAPHGRGGEAVIATGG